MVQYIYSIPAIVHVSRLDGCVYLGCLGGLTVRTLVLTIERLSVRHPVGLLSRSYYLDVCGQANYSRCINHD